MPGGQFTNLKAQARSMGLEDRWHEVAQTYADVNQMFGDIVKVTPSSKVVGDMALMMVSQGLTRADVEDPERRRVLPRLGGRHDARQSRTAAGRMARRDSEKGAQGRGPLHRPPRQTPAPRRYRGDADRVVKQLEGKAIDDEDLNAYLMYPKVFLDYMGRHRIYGPVRVLPTRPSSTG